MKVLNKSQTLLSNLEVLEHLSSVKASSRAENVQTIVVELQAYLRQRPTGNVALPQTRANITKFAEEVKANNLALEKAELLQIINSAPASMPVLFCLIEEADIRFTEDQLALILELSEKYLGAEPLPGGDA